MAIHSFSGDPNTFCHSIPHCLILFDRDVLNMDMTLILNILFLLLFGKGYSCHHVIYHPFIAPFTVDSYDHEMCNQNMFELGSLISISRFIVCIFSDI